MVTYIMHYTAITSRVTRLTPKKHDEKRKYHVDCHCEHGVIMYGNLIYSIHRTFVYNALHCVGM